jgi:acetoacetyl-CoA reductase
MKNKVALVTGGTRGIGKSIALDLKKAGAKVVVSFQGNMEAAELFRRETNIPTYRFDVANFDACNEVVRTIEQEVGAIDILINNAGITRDGFMHKMNEDSWNSVIDTNLNSCFNMCRAVIEGMRSRKYGRIINISSVNGQLGQFGQTNYSAAKAGVFGFTKALARECASKGITVNAVAPGYIGTDMVRAVSEDVMQKIVSNIPVGRLGDPKEVARAVCFLAASSAGFITGETLSINGGQHME